MIIKHRNNGYNPIVNYPSETPTTGGICWEEKKRVVVENKFNLISQMWWLLDHCFQAQSPLFSPSSGWVFWPCNVRWQRAQQCCKLFLTVGWGTRGKDSQSPETDSAWCGNMGPAPMAWNKKKPGCSLSPAAAGTWVCLQVWSPSAVCIMCLTAMLGQKNRGSPWGKGAFSRLIIICSSASQWDPTSLDRSWHTRKNTCCIIIVMPDCCSITSASMVVKYCIFNMIITL